MRGLDKNFMTDLDTGILKPILELVKDDSTLCLEIRDNYINIYYRGGNILRITEAPNGYKTFFDNKYLKYSKFEFSPTMPIKDKASVNYWVEAIPQLKNAMDLWFTKNPKDEREFQQLVVRENNFSGSAKGTDYFICDMEYANSEGRFDMIAAGWPSKSSDRKNSKNIRLAFIEMKYMDKALKGKAGLHEHIIDMDNYLSHQDNLMNIKIEMIEVFKQKLELGLIDITKKIEQFSDDKPEYILLLANHDPDSKILQDQLANLPAHSNFELKFAVSSFMGYGLYRENIYGLQEFQKKFAKQIKS